MYRNPRLKAALAYAKKGKPVFPCMGKTPLTSNGFKDATTDPKTIRGWWTKWPKANIAIPTGKRSGFWVLDVDTEGLESFGKLVTEHGELPDTLRSKTGGGGLHFLFAWPEDIEIRNTPGDLPDGIHVRGEGGYIIVPPSVTEAPYEWTNSATTAPAPGWLIEMVRHKPHKPSGPRPGGGRRSLPIDDGTVIRNGERNNTIARIAGRMHDGTRDVAGLIEDLLRVNEALCEVPLPEEEVRRIAQSIYRYDPCTPGKTQPPGPEVVGVLGKVLKEWWESSWKGTGGKTRRDFLLTVEELARERGEVLPNGDVLIDVSFREAARRCRASTTACFRAFKSLRMEGRIRTGGNGPDRKPQQASGIVLIAPQNRARISGTQSIQYCRQPDWVDSVPPVRAPSARRGRHSSPGISRSASKTRIAVVDYLERYNDWLSEEDVAGLMDVKRARDVRRRHLEPLEERGVLERYGKLWRLTTDWKAALERIFAEEENTERELYGGKTADEMQKERDERSTDGFLTDIHPDKAPTEEEMDEKREERLKNAKETHKVKVAKSDRRFKRKIEPPSTDAYDLYERQMWQRVTELERDLAEWAS